MLLQLNDTCEETLKIASLTTGRFYPIVSVCELNTKHGRKVTAKIIVGDNKLGQVFLPNRYGNRIGINYIKKLNEGRFGFIFEGGDHNTINILGAKQHEENEAKRRRLS